MQLNSFFRTHKIGRRVLQIRRGRVPHLVWMETHVRNFPLWHISPVFNVRHEKYSGLTKSAGNAIEGSVCNVSPIKYAKPRDAGLCKHILYLRAAPVKCPYTRTYQMFIAQHRLHGKWHSYGRVAASVCECRLICSPSTASGDESGGRTETVIQACNRRKVFHPNCSGRSDFHSNHYAQ